MLDGSLVLKKILPQVFPKYPKQRETQHIFSLVETTYYEDFSPRCQDNLRFSRKGSIYSK